MTSPRPDAEGSDPRERAQEGPDGAVDVEGGAPEADALDPPAGALGPATGTPGPDPTEQSRWRPLHRLLASLDDEIAELYAERRITGLRPRFTGPLIRLGRRGPMTIGELAAELRVTHSAMSQTVGALRREGLVRSRPGADARTRLVELTEKAREVVPFLEAEWRATERALAELEDEIPYALSQVVRDLQEALGRRRFRDRVAAHLEREGWGPRGRDETAGTRGPS